MKRNPFFLKLHGDLETPSSIVLAYRDYLTVVSDPGFTVVLAGYRVSKTQGLKLAEGLTTLADTLALTGRGSESGPLLEEAQRIAGNFKNVGVDILKSRGDVAFYQGNFRGAKEAYEQSARIAAKGGREEGVLLAKMNLARVAIAEGRSKSAIGDLRLTFEQVENRHLKYYSVCTAVDLAQALIQIKEFGRAREQLEFALNQSERMGLRLQTARSNYFLGETARLSGESKDAEVFYGKARAILDELKKEPGAEHLPERFDLREIYANSARFMLAKE